MSARCRNFWYSAKSGLLASKELATGEVMNLEEDPLFLNFYNWWVGKGLSEPGGYSEEQIVNYFNEFSDSQPGSDPLLEEAAPHGLRSIFRKRNVRTNSIDTSKEKEESLTAQEQEHLETGFYSWLDEKVADAKIARGTIFEYPVFFRLYQAYIVSRGVENVPRQLDKTRSLKNGKLYIEVIEYLNRKGLNLQVSRSLSSRALSDYMDMPLHAVFLFTSEDHIVEKYINENSSALITITSTWCDIHGFKSEGNGYDLVNRLHVIQQAGFQAFSQFPGLYFWDHSGKTEYIPLGSRASEEDLREKIRVIFEIVQKTPSISSVTQAKALVTQMAFPTSYAGSLSPELLPVTQENGHILSGMSNSSQVIEQSPSKKKRIDIPEDVKDEVLFLSDRTCCKCHIPRKPIQIHHIDEDPANNAPQNLAVLCLECHDETQVSGGFSRKLSAGQVRRYRDDWIAQLAKQRGVNTSHAIE